MKKFLALFFFFIWIIASLSSPSCKKQSLQENTSEKTLPKDTDGDLHVTFVSPKGQTSSSRETDSVVIMFDKAMIPLEALSQKQDISLLSLEPSFPGKYRWLGVKTLAFSPEKRLPFSTEFRAKIPAGTKSLDGSVLREDFTWNFRTLLPALIKHIPQNNQKWVKPDSPILLVFNQPILKEKAKEFLSFLEVSESSEESILNFRIESPSKELLQQEYIEADPEQIMLIIPESKFKPGYTYYVEVKPGLLGKEGSLGSEKSYVFKFESYRKFRLETLEIKEAHNPYEPLKFIFSNPVSYKEFISKVRFEPPVEIPEYYSNWEYAESTLWLSLPLEPEKDYTVLIPSELKDEVGNELDADLKFRFSTSAYPPHVQINPGQGILEAYGGLTIPLYAVNARKVVIRAAKINKEEIIPLLNSEKVFWSSEKFNFEKYPFSQKTLSLELKKNRYEVRPLGIDEFISRRFGFIFLEIDTLLESKWERYPKTFLQITELAISGKFSPENNIIWVTELKTGTPVEGAEVEIRDDTNKTLWKGRTDEEGKAQTPGWAKFGLKPKSRWDTPRQWVFAQRGDDIAFSNSEWGTGIYPYRFGINYEWYPQPTKIEGYIFSEKGIYRVGEKVHLKGIFRQREKGEWRLPAQKEIECEIQDPFNKTVFKQNLNLDRFGSFETDFETEKGAPLGSYEVRAKFKPLVKDEEPTTITSSFRIEAFRGAEFEVHLKSRKESYIFGEKYQAEVSGSYLYGGAMEGQKVSWHLRLNPSSFVPPGYKDYVFGNQIDRWERYEEQESRLIHSGEATLNKQGKYEISANLIPEKEKDSVLATLEATVEDPGRRSVSTRIETMVHRGEYYIGLRPSAFLHEKGKELTVEIISTTPDGNLIPSQEIVLKLLRREWHSVKKAGIGGYRWISEKKDTEIETKELRTGDSPLQISFTPEKAGLYILIARGADSFQNDISTSTYFYVVGRDYVAWERKDDDILELVTDKDTYQPGEMAEILIKSPYERAMALMTIEREFIIEQRVMEIEGSTSRIRLPIKAEYIPNVYLSLLLVQGRTSVEAKDTREDLGKPSFKIGYTSLKVDPSEKRLRIVISKDKEVYKPKEKVRLNLKVKDSQGRGTHACLSVAVVDVGILNIIGYQTPDPFSHFYAEKPLSVQTSDTRLHLIGQREYGKKGEEVGGGAEEEKAMAPLAFLAEVELRGDFRATAYWNPSLITDDEGNANIEFILPDNLTTFRIMTVAQTEDSRFGRQESTFKVSKPLLLLPSLPRFIRVGDRFEGGVTIHSNSSEKGNVLINCEAEGISLLEKKPIKKFSLLAGEAREILFPFEALQPGIANLSFRAQMGKETDGLQITIPIELPRASETVATSGEAKESLIEKISIPENVFHSESKLEFRASSSLLSGLKGCVDYLTEYPFLCLEQQVSSILPYLVASNIIQDFQLSKFNREQISQYVQETINEFTKYQKENGGFGLWIDSTSDSPFLTCFTVFALLKAKDQGYEVNEYTLNQSQKYLRQLVRGRLQMKNYPYSLRSWKTTQAFALYILGLLHDPHPSFVEKLFTEREELSLFGKTLLLKALYHGRGNKDAQDALFEELMNKIKVTPTDAHFEDDEGERGGWIYSSNLRTTSFILQSMIEIGREHPLMSNISKWIVKRKKAGKWASTQENFYAFYALNEFYKKYEGEKPDFKLKVLLKDEALLEEAFRGKEEKVITCEKSLKHFTPGEVIPLKIYKDGFGPLFYETRMTYAPKYRFEPLDEGIVVHKEIKSMEGKPLEYIKAGSLIIVTLKVIVPQESLFVVIEDPLPAGFEAVNPTFITESEEEQRRLQEMQRDVERYWWQGFNHIEMHDNKVLLFADSLPSGVHTHSYMARALTPGIFNSPGTKAEQMYSPEVFGRAPEVKVEIRK